MGRLCWRGKKNCADIFVLFCSSLRSSLLLTLVNFSLSSSLAFKLAEMASSVAAFSKVAHSLSLSSLALPVSASSKTLHSSSSFSTLSSSLSRAFL